MPNKTACGGLGYKMTSRDERIKSVHQGLLKQDIRILSPATLVGVFQKTFGVKKATAQDYVTTMGKMGLARVPHFGKIELIEEKKG